MSTLPLSQLWSRRRWPTGVEWIALVLLAITAASVETWLHSTPKDPWRAWMPNAAPGAFFVALTITIIDGAIRRRDRARLRPLLDPILATLNAEYGTFVEAVAEDYATPHLGAIKAIPTRPLDLLDSWLAEQDSADASHIGLEPDNLPLVEIGREFAEQVAWHEQQLGPEMPPELWAECRNFARTPQRVAGFRELSQEIPELYTKADLERRAYRAYVSGARAFGEILARHRPAPVHDRVEDDVIEWAENERRQRIEDEARSRG